MSLLPIDTRVPALPLALLTTGVAPRILETPAPQEQQPEALAEFGPYRARLAVTDKDKLAAYRLRFLVFNLEMQEGLESAFANGYDTDQYDDVCDHLIVEEKLSGNVIGTYRLQTGASAAKNFGYYSEQEFDFTPYESIRASTVELGRACIHKDYRSAEVLNLLWRGIMRYTLKCGGRYLIGCCSLTSQDESEGAAVQAALRDYMVRPEMQTRPTAAFALPPASTEPEPLDPPKLLRAYLAIGAKICAPPAIDRAFRTIDFLTMIDIQTIHPRIARRFL